LILQKVIAQALLKEVEKEKRPLKSNGSPGVSE
jgi:hypothetical protein